MGQYSKTSTVAIMMRHTNAGDASNALTCVRGMASCKPRVSSSVKRPRFLAVPRSTLQAWRTYQESLDACPAVGAFFHSVPGLAFLHRLALALHVVCVEIGACGIRLGCLVLELTGLNRFVGASFGTPQQVNRHVEETMVTSQHEETARLAEQMPPNDRLPFAAASQ